MQEKKIQSHNETLQTKILSFINYKKEDQNYDFKRDWHTTNNRLLHDIICMANNMTFTDGYIIIGIDESNDYSINDVKNDTKRKNTASIADFLSKIKFAGDIRPTVYVENINIEDKTIDVIIIKSDNNVPYYLKEDYTKGSGSPLKKGMIWTRVGDKNTAIDDIADVDKIEKLWKRRFGIDVSAKQRLYNYLRNPKEWRSIDGNQKYYIFAPEYTIKRELQEDGNDWFFNCNQCNKEFDAYNLYLCYHATVMDIYDAFSLDGGRTFNISGKFDGIKLGEENGWSLRYRYYIKNELDYLLNNMFKSECTDYNSFDAFMEWIIIFESDNERKAFIDFIRSRWNNETVVQYIKETKPQDTVGEIDDSSDYYREYMETYLLKKELENFRNNCS